MRSSVVNSFAPAAVSVLLATALLALAGMSCLWGTADAPGPNLNLAQCSPDAIVGRVHVTGKEILSITPDSQGRGLILCKIDAPAARWAAVSYSLSGPGTLEAAFVWEHSADRGKVFHLTLPEDGSAVALTNQPGWDGTVTRAGILIRTAGGGAPPPGLELEAIRGRLALVAGGLSTAMEEAWTHWYGFRGWVGRSINHLGGTRLPLLFLAWIVACILIGLAIPSGRRRRTALLAGALSTVLAWLALEGLWLSQLERQAELTNRRFAGAKTDNPAFRTTDWRLAELCRATRKLAEPGRHVLVVTDLRYLGEKARYMLLPLSAAHIRNLKQLPGALKALDPGDLIAAMNVDAKSIQRMLRSRGVASTLVWSRENRGVIRIDKMPAAPQEGS